MLSTVTSDNTPAHCYLIATGNRATLRERIEMAKSSVFGSSGDQRPNYYQIYDKHSGTGTVVFGNTVYVIKEAPLRVYEATGKVTPLQGREKVAHAVTRYFTTQTGLLSRTVIHPDEHYFIALRTSSQVIRANNRTFSLQREFETLSQFKDSPGIAQVCDYWTYGAPRDESEGPPPPGSVGGILVMHRYGQTLGNTLENGPIIDQKTKLDLMEKLLTALDAIHKKGIVHRKISTSNIYVEEGHPIIANFSYSLSPAEIHGEKIAHKLTSKTIPYCPPEVAHKIYAPMSDLEESVEVGKADSDLTITTQLEGSLFGSAYDIWSMGIVFMAFACEDIPSTTMQSLQDEQTSLYSKLRHRAALHQKDLNAFFPKMNHCPLQNVIRQMLDPDPRSRISAEEALHQVRQIRPKPLAAALE